MYYIECSLLLCFVYLFVSNVGSHYLDQVAIHLYCVFCFQPTVIMSQPPEVWGQPACLARLPFLAYVIQAFTDKD